MADFASIPHGATLQPKPFKAHIPDEKLRQFQQLIKSSPVGPAVFENTSDKHGRYGMSRDWLMNAKKIWETEFDWRRYEDRINSYPNFTVPIWGQDGETIEIHFVALFSQREDAMPLAMYHGWPSSFMDFADILDLLKDRYTPSDLPYHVIVPSLPGYAFSGTPPVDVDYNIPKAAHLLNNLMTGLGFSEYIAHGGDLGSGISREQAAGCEACTGFHLSMILQPPPPNKDQRSLHEIEQKALPRGLAFRRSGMAYAMEHGTKGATIGLALQASPLAMLSWIGEKMLAWSDQDPSVEVGNLPEEPLFGTNELFKRVLANVSLYWLTETFPRGLYPYRRFASGDEPDFTYIDKPLGYSFFPGNFPVPVSWAQQGAKLVHFNRHDSGGHFAAWEKPRELLDDIEAYMGVIRPAVGGKRVKLSDGVNGVNGKH